MAETFLCDECDERIDQGFTVSWCPNLKDNAHGVAWDRNEKTRNLCRKCFPRSKPTLVERIAAMLP